MSASSTAIFLVKKLYGEDFIAEHSFQPGAGTGTRTDVRGGASEEIVSRIQG
jgi:hypothetical protein